MTDEPQFEQFDNGQQMPHAEFDDLIREALSDEDGPVTRWVIVYEQVTPRDSTMIGIRDSGDPPWIGVGLLRWAIGLYDEERGGEPL